MNPKHILVESAPWFVASILLAGLVHIASILLMPRVAPKDAYGRVMAMGGAHQILVLPRAIPGSEVMPFRDPAIASGICRYDLREGPLRIRTTVGGEGFLSLAFLTRYNSVFYSMTERAASHGKIDVLLVSAAQLETIEAQDNEDEPVQELRLRAPAAEGYVHLSLFAPSPSAYGRAEAQIKAIDCRLDLAALGSSRGQLSP